jgi:RND family efflux transporter MFP subunit
MRSSKLLYLFLVVAGIVVVLLATRRSLSHAVEAETVTRANALDAVPAIVQVRSDYTFTLSSEEGGRVERSSLKLGALIEQDALVLEIDPSDLEIEATILQADITNLTTRLELKSAEADALLKQQEDLKNLERLYAAGNYPELEIQRKRRAYKVFEERQELDRLNKAQQLQSLQNKLQLIERRLEKTKIYAPTSGIVTTIYAYPGELVRSGTALAEVFSQAIVVEAKVNEENFSGITTGQTVNVRLLTHGNQLFTGTISQVLPTADKAKQQYTVLIELDIEPKLLIPGLSGEASIIRRKVANALVIPSRALMGDYVFKVIGNEAILTPVKIGVRGLNHVEIKEGLNEGDVIITDDMESLKDGGLIRIKNK